MSALSSVSIPKPQDWAAFERASVELWRFILNDHGLQRYGRTGQAQYGLDFFGYRNRQAIDLVGVQCKCFGSGQKLQEALVREETAKAVAHLPGMTEYIIATTVEDSTAFADLGATLTREYTAKGRNIIIRVWGWGTLEQEIQRFPDAHKAFDPNYTPYVEALFDKFKGEFATASDQIVAAVKAEMSQRVVDPVSQIPIVSADFVDSDQTHNAELDRYRTLMGQGKVATALTLIQAKEADLPVSSSASIRCRLKGLIGHCHRILGNFPLAIAAYEEAYGIAPDDARGRACRTTALALGAKYADAFEFGLASLRADPTNEAAMIWMVFAAAELKQDHDLDAIVPEGLRDKESYAEARTGYFRTREVTPAWWNAARQGFERFPTNTLLKCASADSQLDELIKSDGGLTGELTPEWRQRLIDAANVLTDELRKTYASEVPNRSDTSGIALNASAIFAALRRIDEARDVLAEALDHHPENLEIAVRLAQVAANVGDVAAQNRALAIIPNDGTALEVKIQILDFQSRWDEIVELAKSHALPPRRKGTYFPTEIIVQCARIRVRPKKKGEQALRKLIDQYSGPKTDLVVAINLANSLGLPALADLAYTKVKASLHDNSHFVERVNVALAASSRQDLETIADVLFGHVDTSFDTSELRLLAKAFANLVPVSSRAMTLFEGLPPDLRNRDPYDRFEANARFNGGDIEGAQETANRVLLRDPKDLSIILLNAYASGRLKRDEDLQQLVAGINPAEVDGSPFQRMQLAHLYRAHGRAMDGVDLGYRLTLSHPNDPQLALKYAGLFFGRNDDELEISTPFEVADRTWVL